MEDDEVEYTEALEAAVSKPKYLLSSLFDLEDIPKDASTKKKNRRNNSHSMSRKILIIVDNVYRGFSFIVCLTIVTMILIATFRPHTAGLHQAIVSIYWVGLFVPPWLLVIGVSQTSLMVGGLRSKALLVLWEEKTDPSAVRCSRDRLSCCLIAHVIKYGLDWIGKTWTGLIKDGVIKHGLIEHGLIKHEVIKHGLIKDGVRKHGLIKHGVIKHGLIKHGLIKHGLIKRGLIKQGLFFILLFLRMVTFVCHV